MLSVLDAAEPEWDNRSPRERFGAEVERRGGFERIFPASDSEIYLDCLDRVSTCDEALLSET